MEFTKKQLIQKAIEVVEKKLLERYQVKSRHDLTKDLNITKFDTQRSINKINIDIEQYLKDYKFLNNALDEIKEEEQKIKILDSYINYHIEIVEHKIEQYCGGIGGPQIQQFRYEYTLEEK